MRCTTALKKDPKFLKKFMVVVTKSEVSFLTSRIISQIFLHQLLERNLKAYFSSPITDLMRNSEENKLKSALASPQVGVDLKDAVEKSMKRVGDNANAFKDHGVIRAYQDVIRGLFTPEIIAGAQPSIANLQKFSDFERLTMCIVRCYELMDDVLEALRTKHKQVEKSAYTKVTKSVFDRMSDSLNSKFYYKLDVFRLIDDILHEIEDVLREQKLIREELDAAQASNSKAVQLAERERKLKNKKTVECGVTKLADLIRMPLTRLLPKPVGDGKDVFDSTSFEDSLRDNIRKALTYGGSPQDRYVYFYVHDKRKKPFEFFKVLFLQVLPDMSLATTQICCFEPGVSQTDKDSVIFSDYKLEVNPNSLLKQSTAPVNNIEVICDDELEYYDITSKLLVTIYYLVFKQFGINGVKSDHYSKFDQLVPKVVLAAEHLFDFLAFIRSGYVGARPSNQTTANHISLSTVPLGDNPLLHNNSTRYQTHHSLLDIYGTPLGSQPPSSRPLQQNYLSGRGDSGLVDNQVGGRLQKLLDNSSGVLQRREEEARARGLLNYAGAGADNSNRQTLYGGSAEDREAQLERIRKDKEAREAIEREKREERERRERERREKEDAEFRERAEKEKRDREAREAARREKEAREREEREERDRKAREEREAREKEARERREKEDRERREREEKDRAARAEKELRDKEEREKRDRELKDRLEREENERRERDARERQEREEKDRIAREEREERDRIAREEREKRDQADRERREQMERERREQAARDQAERDARDAADRAARELKEQELREQREREQREREEREAEAKAQREAEELKRELEREKEAERKRLQDEAAERDRVANLKRLEEEAAEAEKLRLKAIEDQRKQRELEEQAALRKREAEIEQAEIEAQNKKMETKAEEDIEDDFFDDFDVEESGPSKKVVPPPKQPEKSPSVEEEPVPTKPSNIAAKKDEEDEFLDDFDDLDDFTGSIGKKSAQNQVKKQETPKPKENKPEVKNDEFDDFDDFDDFGNDPTPKKEVPAAKKPDPPQENPKQPIQAKKRIAADDEFEFDDEDFDDILEDEPKKSTKEAEKSVSAPAKEQKPSEPSKEDSIPAETPAPIQDKSEIKGGIMALKKLASNKPKEPAAEPALAANGENRRRDPRAIKAGDMPLITQVLTQTQPISEDEVQYVMGNTKFDSLVLQTLFNDWVSAKTVFFLELPETEAMLVNVLDNRDKPDEFQANIQDLGGQIHQVLAETFAEQPEGIEEIKFILAAFQLAQGLEEELVVFGAFDAQSKQVMLASIAPGMTQAVLRESPIALAIADCLAQTANFAIFGKELSPITPEQIIAPTIPDGLGQFLEESCEDPMLRFIVMSYLILYEPATDVLDLEGFKASLEIEEYGIEHAARFVLSIRNADQANKLRAQMQETPEITKPMMIAVDNLATEKKAELVMKLAEQVIPEDEISKFVTKDVEEILEKKAEGFERVFAVLEYCPNQDSSISYFICLDDSQPNLLIGSTVSQEPLNSKVIEQIKSALAKAGRKQLEIYAEHPRNQFMKDQLDYLVCTWALQVCDYGLSPLDGFRCTAYNEGSCVNEIMAGLEIGEDGAEEGLDPEQAMIQGEAEDSLGREEGKDEQDEFGDIDLDDDDFGAKKAPPDKPSVKQTAATAAAKSKLNYDQDFDLDDFDQDIGKGGDDNGANFDDLDDLDF